MDFDSSFLNTAVFSVSLLLVKQKLNFTINLSYWNPSREPWLTYPKIHKPLTLSQRTSMCLIRLQRKNERLGNDKNIPGEAVMITMILSPVCKLTQHSLTYTQSNPYWCFIVSLDRVTNLFCVTREADNTHISCQHIGSTYNLKQLNKAAVSYSISHLCQHELLYHNKALKSKFLWCIAGGLMEEEGALVGAEQV